MHPLLSLHVTVVPSHCKRDLCRSMPQSFPIRRHPDHRMPDRQNRTPPVELSPHQGDHPVPDRRNCYRSQPLADQAAPALPGIRLPAHLQSAEPAMIWTNGDVSQFPGRARQWSAAGQICPWQRQLRDHPEAIFSVFREDPVKSASLTATGFEPCAERPYRCRLHCDRWSPSLLINGSS